MERWTSAYQMRTTSASFAAATFPLPACTSTWDPSAPIPSNVFRSFRPVSSRPTVAMNRLGSASSGASRNCEAVGVEIPEGGSEFCPCCRRARFSSDVSVPERMAIPIVPHPAVSLTWGVGGKGAYPARRVCSPC